MIKILFCDLDGTLLLNGDNHSGRVSNENIKAIKKLEENGIKFGIATSRSNKFIYKQMECEHEIDTVAFNGNLVTCDHKILSNVSFTYDELLMISRMLKVDEDNRHMFITIDNDVLFYDLNYKRVQGYIKNELNYVQDHNIILNENFYDYLKEHYHKICFIIGVFPNKEIADKAREELKLLESIQYVDTSERTCTFTKNNIDKVTGILEIANYYGIKEDEIAVIGDSYNDLKMIQTFKHSFCMSHGPESIKKESRYIVNHVHECIEMILKMNEMA